LIDALDALGRPAPGGLPATLGPMQNANASPQRPTTDAGAAPQPVAPSLETPDPSGQITRGEAEQIRELRNLGGKLDALKEAVVGQETRAAHWGP